MVLLGLDVVQQFSQKEENGVAWNGSLWVAVGEGTNSIATSPDGITWTGLGTTIFTTGGSGVAWNRGLGNVSGSDVILNKNGPGLSNKLDIVAPPYYNTGYNNFSMSITPK